MRRMFLSVFTVCALMFVSCAGGGHGVKHNADGKMDGKALVEMMDGVLDLTDDQEKSMIQLYEEFNAEVKDLDKEEAKVKMKEMNDKVMNILDEDQKVIFKGFMKMHGMMGKK